MYSAQAKHRVTTAIAGLLIAGSGLLATATVSVADAQPGAGTPAGAVGGAPAGTTVPAPAVGTDATAATAGAPAAAGVTGTTAATGVTDALTTPALATAEPRGRVTSRLPLSIREHATSTSRLLGSLPSGAVVYLRCKVVGQNVDGNNLWYRLGNGRPGYVSARYVHNLSAVPYCN